jgi:hypothetical protein
MKDGQLKGFSESEVKLGKAVGVKLLSRVDRFDIIGDKLILIREMDKIWSMSFKCDVVASAEKFDDPKNYAEILLSDKKYIRFVPVPVSQELSHKPTLYFIFR